MTLSTCPKCSGEGIVRQYGHVQGGQCFRCKGAGVVHGRMATKKDREDLQRRIPELIAQNEQRRAEAQAAWAREMAATGGLGSILFAAMQRQQQEQTP